MAVEVVLELVADRVVDPGDLALDLRAQAIDVVLEALLGDIQRGGKLDIELGLKPTHLGDDLGVHAVLECRLPRLKLVDAVIVGDDAVGHALDRLRECCKVLTVDLLLLHQGLDLLVSRQRLVIDPAVHGACRRLPRTHR